MTSSQSTVPSSSRRRANRRSRALAVAAVACTIALLPLSTGTASAAPTDDNKSLQELQQQRAAVRQEKSAQASEVNALKASDAEVRSALSTLTANVNAQQDRLEEAQRAVQQAEADRTAAEQAQAQKQAELDAITSKMKQSAVAAYVSMGSADGFSTLGADNINDAVNKRTLMGVRANESIDLTEKFRSVQEDLEKERAAAADAEQRATDNKATVANRLGELNSAYEEQQAFAAQVDQRLDSALAEADSLASIDAQLASSISSKQNEIAKAVAAQRAAAAARTAKSVSSSSSSGGSSGGGGAPANYTPTGSGEIVSVNGIRVHRSIAGNLSNLLSAAAASGIQLSGGGFRDPAGQIAVRRSNCGTSNYAIYQMPSSSCSPPTARPGTSMHERGLAVDFTQGGSTLTRSSSGYAWMKANASSYGFFNLPSEAWHWSTNGN